MNGDVCGGFYERSLRPMILTSLLDGLDSLAPQLTEYTLGFVVGFPG